MKKLSLIIPLLLLPVAGYASSSIQNNYFCQDGNSENMSVTMDPRDQGAYVTGLHSISPDNSNTWGGAFNVPSGSYDGQHNGCLIILAALTKTTVPVMWASKMQATKIYGCYDENICNVLYAQDNGGSPATAYNFQTADWTVSFPHGITIRQESNVYQCGGTDNNAVMLSEDHRAPDSNKHYWVWSNYNYTQLPPNPTTIDGAPVSQTDIQCVQIESAGQIIPESQQPMVFLSFQQGRDRDHLKFILKIIKKIVKTCIEYCEVP